MSKWVTPISDRTATDITDRTSKAFFNVLDWLRVHDNTRLVESLLQIMRVGSADLTDLTAPGITTFPDATGINALVENINAVTEAAGLPAALGVAVLEAEYTGGSGGVAPDYDDVNAWEQALDLTRPAVLAIADDLVFCGVAETGQARHWQARYHAFAYVQPIANWKRKARSGNAVCGAGFERQNSWRRYA